MLTKDFSKNRTQLEIPDLLKIQIESYQAFLQYDTPPDKRKDEGLQAVFKEAFPVGEIHRNYTLEFVSYSFGNPKYTPEEAIKKGATYSIPLKVTFRLLKKEPKKTEAKPILIEEQEVYFCDIPYMTSQGTFIINGVERVVISQLHRAPGIYFSKEGEDYSALLVPLRGAWIEFILDKNNTLNIILDRRRKIPLMTYLRAIGYTPDDLWQKLFNPEKQELTKGQYLAETLENEEGHPLFIPGDELTEQAIQQLTDKKIKAAKQIPSTEAKAIEVLKRTIKQDRTATEEEAIKKVYYRIRGMQPHSTEVAKNIIKGILFDPRRFEIGKVGRYRINQQLGGRTKDDAENSQLKTEDLFLIIKRLLQFFERKFPPDDIDHLANRRVRRVGELLENQFRIALQQLIQNTQERAQLIEERSLHPQDLIQPRLVANYITKFFTQGQLSQFLEQTNPLTELTHKRRITALGPGGLTKETAGFEARDVHYSHYGRICPIETPEGPNIGLITTLATYAQLDTYGFITTPYRKISEGRITKTLHYLNPYEEEPYTIAQANTPISTDGRILSQETIARHKGSIITTPPETLDYIDATPKQLFAPSTILIPFLEHDDADRALMGANMQRQAVPLLIPEPPLVATGVETQFATESGAVLRAEQTGEVYKADANSILLRTETGLTEYQLTKFKKSNQNTCLTQRPLVKPGMQIKKGDLLADGPATSAGQLALGRNVLCAFLPWYGHNYEDAIIVSEDLLKHDLFTSIHILEFEIQARETKLGPEEITRDIPGATEEDLKDLDEFGIIRVGAEVHPGDILVGRITPRAETEFTPEERLLRAIFGDKASNVRDTSLRTEPGVFGVVIERRILSRRTQDALARHLDRQRAEEVENAFQFKKRFALKRRDERLQSILKNEPAASTIKDSRGKVLIKAQEKWTEEIFASPGWSKIKDFSALVDSKKQSEVQRIIEEYETTVENLEKEKKQELSQIQRGEELPQGVLKWVRIFIAQKRRLSVGDKMAGRHGNKGVVAKILPVEDMPHLSDGTPVEIILNPLGVPSRMNIGQILEAHLGWAAKVLGYQAICPVFEGATPEEIKEELRKAGLPEDGKVTLYDGRTGREFEQKVVVGYLYMMKLIHMVDDKIHARSTGKYSLITQQPLGGKAQFGGQRFGEMEVWALEAYGAAYTLQEMLTIKSDDVDGRSMLYESLLRMKEPPQPKVPASFSVLVKELQGLGLELTPLKEKR